MIPKACKRLPEIEFPIAEVSKQAVREKSIRCRKPLHRAVVEKARGHADVSVTLTDGDQE